jgi:hypothetical protein
MAIETLTFGCRLNAYEGAIMKAEAEKAGLDNAIIINTCAVTAEAVRQARQAVRKARRDSPEARIIVTGCAAQTEARSFGDMDEVDLVIGNADKLKSESYRPMVFGTPLNDKVQVNDIMSVRETAGHGWADPCLCAGAEWLRSPLHLLHHPFRPRPLALRAHGPSRRADQEAGGQWLQRSRADRRRHHLLWSRPAR